MIEHLDGIHETVTYKENSSLRLFVNTDCEDYPIHWHTPMEIIMPLEGTYTVLGISTFFFRKVILFSSVQESSTLLQHRKAENESFCRLNGLLSQKSVISIPFSR